MNGKRFRSLGIRLDKAERTPEGYLQGRVPVTRSGVFPYRNDDGTMRRELRHPDDVREIASLESLKLCPLQVEHVAMLDASNVDEYKVGNAGSDVEVVPNSEEPDADVMVFVTVRVDGRRGLDAYDRGVRELSLGYELELEEAEPGSTYKGKPYTHRQRLMRYNHIAITEKARLGSELRLDSADAVEVDSDESPNLPKELKMKKVNIDGIEYDAAPEVVNALAKANKRADTAEEALEKKEDELEEFKKEAKTKEDAANGKLAGVTSDLDKAKKDMADLEASIPAKAAAVAKDRADIMIVAKDSLPAAELAKVANLDNAGIKSAIVKAKYPKIALDSQSADFVNGLFESVKLGLRKDGSDSLAQNRADSAEPAAHEDGEEGSRVDGSFTAADAAYEARAKKNSEAWKNPKIV